MHYTCITCIIDGLPISLQGSAKSGNYKNPEELFQGFSSKLESENIGKEKIEKQVFKPNEVCHICKKSGHMARRCWFRPNDSQLPTFNSQLRPSTTHSHYQ